MREIQVFKGDINWFYKFKDALDAEFSNPVDFVACSIMYIAACIDQRRREIRHEKLQQNRSTEQYRDTLSSQLLAKYNTAVRLKRSRPN